MNGSLYAIGATDTKTPIAGAATRRGWFHFFADRGGKTVPVLSGPDQNDGAISETGFHDMPIQGPYRVVQERRLDALSVLRLVPGRDLRLVELFGHALRRYQVRAEQLTSTEADQYDRTVPWARGIHAAHPDIDGLVWMSRQFVAAKAIVLFGDRVAPTDLRVEGVALPLRIGPGRDLVDRAANLADIAIV